MRLPKKGFTNVLRKEIEAVSIRDIVSMIESKKIDASLVITKESLEKVGLIKCKNSKVKLIMSKKETLLKFKVAVDAYSEKAKDFSAECLRLLQIQNLKEGFSSPLVFYSSTVSALLCQFQVLMLRF
jgi:hypothetical protein